MARLPRLVWPGHAHLVVLRGHSGRPVMVDEADRSAFRAALREAAAAARVAVEAYTLADDHVHLLLRPPTAAALSEALQGLGRRYVAGFNRRHGLSGSPWAGRFRAAVVQPGEREVQAMLFIDAHALRTGRVARLQDDVASSLAHHLGLRRDPLVVDGPPWWRLGNTPFEREAAYGALLAEGLPPQRVRELAEASHKGWALGDAGFIAELGALAGRPAAPRPRGRPRRAA